MSIQHLTTADYRIMPWANGLGQTVEMIRCDDCNGNLLWRISMATVIEDGPFSLFPDIDRNLTVLTGYGFDLVENNTGIHYQAALLTPISFSGDVAVTATNVTVPCKDFNVMTRRGSLMSEVSMLYYELEIMTTTGGCQLVIFALAPSTIRTLRGDCTLQKHDLLNCQQSVRLLKGRVIVCKIYRHY